MRRALIPVKPPTQTPLGFAIGVNLAGMDFVGGPFVPTNAELDYYHGKGVNLIRIPLKWEYIQPTLFGALSATVLASVQGLVTHAAGNGQKIVIDIHNFGFYKVAGTSFVVGSTDVPATALADLWTRLASVFVSNAGIYGYDLMNEPSGDADALWPAVAQQVINAIRLVDRTTLVIIEGVHFSSAPQWVQDNSDLNIIDPANNMAYAPHCYGDSDNSGTYALPYGSDGATPTTMADRMTIPATWAAPRGFRLLHGEGGVPGDTNWLTVYDNLLGYLQSIDAPSFYWAGGPAWGSYPLSCEPQTKFLGTTLPGGAVHDAPQIAVLTKYTGAAQPTSYYALGPSGSLNHIVSSAFTVQYFGYPAADIVVTPGDAGGGGTFTPSTVTLAAHTFNPSATFTYTPSV